MRIIVQYQPRISGLAMVVIQQEVEWSMVAKDDPNQRQYSTSLSIEQLKEYDIDNVFDKDLKYLEGLLLEKVEYIEF
jgi:hypothetical protein